MALTNSDKLLVNRAAASYHVPASELINKLQSSDLMLVNRGGESYKETGANVRLALIGVTRIATPEILSPAPLAGVSDSTTAVDVDTVNIKAAPPTHEGAVSNDRFTSTIWELSTDPSFTANTLTKELPITEFGSIQELPASEFTLQPDTEYYLRVKYSSFDSTVLSDFSAVVQFRTQALNAALIAGETYYCEVCTGPVTQGEIKAKYGADPASSDLRDLGIYPLVPTPAGYTHLYYKKDGDHYLSVPYEFSDAERQAIEQAQALYSSATEFYNLLQAAD